MNDKKSPPSSQAAAEGLSEEQGSSKKAESSSGSEKALVPRSETLPAVRSSGVVPYDALSAYFREIRRYPKLSREEEHELAVQYKEHKDIEAAYALVASNLWLVVKLAKEYERTARHLLDLIQEGNIGLMEAVKNYDPYRGVRFPSYAVWWVKAYIVRYMIANLRIVKVGTTQAQRKLYFNLEEREREVGADGDLSSTQATR
jgi:RNA polymerase sigma-32 factor